MKPLFYVLILIVCFINLSSAQRLYQTSSGQKFMLNDDNSWYFVEGIVQNSDTASYSTETDIENKYAILLKKSLENEVNTYVLWLTKNREITVTEMNIKQTQEASNNPEVLAKLNEKLLTLKKEENAFLTQYSKNAQLTKRVQASQSLQGKKQEKEWNGLAKILQVKFKEKTAVVKKKMEKEELPDKKKEFIEFETEKQKEELPEKAKEKVITAEEELKQDEKPVEKEGEKPVEKQALTEVSVKKKSDCLPHKISVDSVLNRQIIEMEAGFLFNYTPEKLKSYFRTKDFMNAKARILKYDKTHELRLNLTLYSKDAGKTYGYVPKGSLITIQLITGALIRLTNAEESRPGLETYTGNTIYQLSVTLDSDSMKLLEKVAIDHLGIMWSSGYETYTIYEVDFFMNQLKCLKKIR